MYEIITQNPNYCGVTEGVPFANGKAVVADKATADMLAHDYGYTVKEKAEGKPKGNAPAK